MKTFIIVSALSSALTTTHAQGVGKKLLRRPLHRRTQDSSCNLECATDFGTFRRVNKRLIFLVAPTSVSYRFITSRHHEDCSQICSKGNDDDAFGTCIVNVGLPVASPTSPQPTSCEECTSPSSIPDTCEVDILIDIMETGVLGSHELLSQWTRAAFHDAGTYNRDTGEGGANGCLLNHPPMRYVVSYFQQNICMLPLLSP